MFSIQFHANISHQMLHTGPLNMLLLPHDTKLKVQLGVCAVCMKVLRAKPLNSILSYWKKIGQNITHFKCNSLFYGAIGVIHRYSVKSLPDHSLKLTTTAMDVFIRSLFTATPSHSLGFFFFLSLPAPFFLRRLLLHFFSFSFSAQHVLLYPPKV